MKILKWLMIYLVSVLLFACGGDNSNPTTPPPETTPIIPTVNNPAVQTGVFLDSPVINADYRTQTQSGTTNLQGEYQYLIGETVTFAIGNLAFPTTQASAVITPLDIAKTQTITADSVVNMIRLLQSLDKNGNPLDGIEITDAAKQIAVLVNFSQSKSTFAAETNIVNLVLNAGQDTPRGSLIALKEQRVV